MGASDQETAGIRVSVELDSRHDGQPVERAAYAGKLYDKAGVLYLRYEQPVEGGRVGTTLRWDGRELKLVRSGAVESVLTFAPGKTMAGTYGNAHGQLPVETAARYVKMEPAYTADRARGASAAGVRPEPDTLPLPMTWSWAYRLEVGGEAAGEFEIRLTIRKEQQS